jgi:hypothetical protein
MLVVVDAGLGYGGLGYGKNAQAPSSFPRSNQVLNSNLHFVSTGGYGYGAGYSNLGYAGYGEQQHI